MADRVFWMEIEDALVVDERLGVQMLLTLIGVLGYNNRQFFLTVLMILRC